MSAVVVAAIVGSGVDGTSPSVIISLGAIDEGQLAAEEWELHRRASIGEKGAVLEPPKRLLSALMKTEMSIMVNCSENVRRVSCEHGIKLRHVETVACTSSSPASSGGLASVVYQLADIGKEKLTVLGKGDVSSRILSFVRSHCSRSYPVLEGIQGTFDDPSTFVQGRSVRFAYSMRVVSVEKEEEEEEERVCGFHLVVVSLGDGERSEMLFIPGEVGEGKMTCAAGLGVVERWVESGVNGVVFWLGGKNAEEWRREGVRDVVVGDEAMMLNMADAERRQGTDVAYIESGTSAKDEPPKSTSFEGGVGFEGGVSFEGENPPLKSMPPPKSFEGDKPPKKSTPPPKSSTPPPKSSTAEDMKSSVTSALPFSARVQAVCCGAVPGMFSAPFGVEADKAKAGTDMVVWGSYPKLLDRILGTNIRIPLLPKSTPPIATSLGPDLWFLGTGAAAPSKRRGSSSLWLRHPFEGEIGRFRGMLLDAGEGCVGALQRSLGTTFACRAILGLCGVWISHQHTDHQAGLPYLIQIRQNLRSNLPESLQNVPGPWHHPLPILCNSHVHRSLEASDVTDYEIVSPEQWAHDPTSSLFFRNLFLPTLVPSTSIERAGSKRPRSPQSTVPPLLSSLLNFRVVHCHNAIGVKLVLHPSPMYEKPVSIVFSGDTRPCDQVVQAAKDVDLLVHEATFADDRREDAIAKRHSTFAEALTIAEQAKAKRIVLTHFSQRYGELQGRTEAQKNVCLALDGLCISLRSEHLQNLHHQLSAIDEPIANLLRTGSEEDSKL